MNVLPVFWLGCVKYVTVQKGARSVGQWTYYGSICRVLYLLVASQDITNNHSDHGVKECISQLSRKHWNRAFKYHSGRGWMDGWMDGWTAGGWMDWLMDGWMGWWIDGWMKGWLDGWMDSWMDGWLGGGMDGWLDGWMCFLRHYFPV